MGTLLRIRSGSEMCGVGEEMSSCRSFSVEWHGGINELNLFIKLQKKLNKCKKLKNNAA